MNQKIWENQNKDKLGFSLLWNQNTSQALLLLILKKNFILITLLVRAEQCEIDQGFHPEVAELADILPSPPRLPMLKSALQVLGSPEVLEFFASVIYKVTKGNTTSFE